MKKTKVGGKCEHMIWLLVGSKSESDVVKTTHKIIHTHKENDFLFRRKLIFKLPALFHKAAKKIQNKKQFLFFINKLTIGIFLDSWSNLELNYSIEK